MAEDSFDRAEDAASPRPVPEDAIADGGSPADAAEVCEQPPTSGSPGGADASPFEMLADVAAEGAARIWRDVDGEIAQFITAEQRQHTIVQRLMRASQVRLECQGDVDVTGIVTAVYRDCVVVNRGDRIAVAMVEAVIAVHGLPAHVGPNVTEIGASLAATSALSGFIGQGIDARGRDGRMWQGELLAVWGDCIDIALTGGVVTVPLSAISAVFGQRSA